MNDWRVGDVANGHVLTSAGWVPIRHRAESGVSTWYPGDVVRGHVFTGEKWVPFISPPAQHETPNFWSRLSTGNKTAIIAGAPILLIAVAVLASTLNPNAGADKREPFIAIVKKGQETPTENDAQVVAAKKERASAICQLLPSTLKIEDWSGTITRISTELGGDEGTVMIEIAEGIEIITEQGWLNTKDTTIDADSPLFQQLASLETGQEVVFDGTFVGSAEYCIEEDSAGSENGLRTPDFLMTFERIEPA